MCLTIVKKNIGRYPKRPVKVVKKNYTTTYVVSSMAFPPMQWVHEKAFRNAAVFCPSIKITEYSLGFHSFVSMDQVHLLSSDQILLQVQVMEIVARGNWADRANTKTVVSRYIRVVGDITKTFVKKGEKLCA